MAFHGEVERRGQPREPRAGDGNALRLAVGLGRAANAGVGILNTGLFQGRDADGSAGLRSAASRLAGVIANPAEDGGKRDDAGV